MGSLHRGPWQLYPLLQKRALINCAQQHLSCCRFLKYLAACGASLKEDWHELTPLHINLGPQWSKQIHDDFRANDPRAGIVEPRHTGWERPPGLGTFALENMFHLCTMIRQWLHSEDLQSVVSLKFQCKQSAVMHVLSASRSHGPWYDLQLGAFTSAIKATSCV